MLGSLGLLIIRLVVGLTFAAHGAQKLFGWFGGGGLEGTGAFFETFGLKPGKPLALMAGLGEFFGGLLFALGLLTPLAALLMIATMIVAIITVAGKNGFWAQNGGSEYNVTIIAVALGIALTGPGTYSLDWMLFRWPW